MRAGCDEAGKGPVLGSMFAAAVVTPDPKVLPDAVADSRQLTPTKRSDLAATLRSDPAVTLGVAEVPVARIDASDTDMNTLTVQAHARALVDALPADVEEVPVVVDAGDPDADRFARRVETVCDRSVTVTGRHSAEASHQTVAAASIVAKVRRDAHIEALADEYGPIGSGYPSDPQTRSFLASYYAKHGTCPPIARESWSTCADLRAAAEQSHLGNF